MIKPTQNLTPDWVLNAAAVEELLHGLGFHGEVVAHISQVAREVAQSDKATKLLEFCRCWQSCSSPGVLPSAWNMLAVVSSFPEAIQKHSQRRVPEHITRATLLDLQRRMEEYFARNGNWGFDKLTWMRHHMSGEFFEIGRLQYALGTFTYPFRVYRDGETGEVVPLAAPGLRCSIDGWPADEAVGFEATLEERNDGIIGYRTSPQNGSIQRIPIRLAASSHVLLNEYSTVAYIHIPGWNCKRELNSDGKHFE